MTIEGALRTPVAMASDNVLLTGPVGAATGLAGRWDTWEIIKCVTPGNGGDAIAARRIQLTSGMAAAQDVLNVNTTSEILTADNRWQYGITQYVPNNGAVRNTRIAPTHARGRFRYILSSTGQRSVASNTSLGSATPTQYITAIETSDVFAHAVNGRFETRIPSASVPIRRVEMTWRDQGPHLLCEWAVLKSVSPQYSLYYPVRELCRRHVRLHPGDRH